MATIDEQFVEHSRLIRPFGVKRLADALHQVLGYSAGIRERTDRLTLDPPRDPDDWQRDLHEIGAMLENLADACDEAAPRIEALIRSAPGEHQRAVGALVTVIRGLQQQEASGDSEAARAA